MSQLRDTSAPGQALEFEIWSDLIKQSHGLAARFSASARPRPRRGAAPDAPPAHGRVEWLHGGSGTRS